MANGTRLSATHPARFSKPIINRLAQRARNLPGPILDCFAGTGRIHELGRTDTWGIEIEPPGSTLHPHHQRTIQGDATALPFPDHTFGTVITSPTYGNRMADNYAGDGTPRHTYRIAQGHPLQTNNTGSMQWGPTYQKLHELAWSEVWRVLRPDGHLIVNISDHIRRRQRQHVSAWHWLTLQAIGFHPTGLEHITTRRQRHGANRNARLPTEILMTFNRPAQSATNQLGLPIDAVA